MTDQAISPKPPSQPELTSSTPSDQPARTTHRFVWTLLALALLLGMVALAWFSLAETSSAEVDPESIEPVEIGEVSVTSEESTPVPRTAITASISQEQIDAADHPLDPLLEMARHGANVVEANVQDYTATIIKRVRSKGRLQDEEFVECKIRHARDNPDDPERPVPFSVYTRFLKPKTGQEVIWIEGHNDGKLIAHPPAGLANVLTLRLDPDSKMAMKGNRYTIRSIGMLNLIKQMIEKGERDRAYDDCEVRITRNIKIGDALCTRLEIIHPEKADHFEFHRAEIFIDDARNLPIAYRGYVWPDQPGGKPKLIERYLYTDIKINVGLTDYDFDPSNEAYAFPGH